MLKARNRAYTTGKLGPFKVVSGYYVAFFHFRHIFILDNDLPVNFSTFHDKNANHYVIWHKVVTRTMVMVHFMTFLYQK